jgi:hypothetical protein
MYAVLDPRYYQGGKAFAAHEKPPGILNRNLNMAWPEETPRNSPFECTSVNEVAALLQ